MTTRSTEGTYTYNCAILAPFRALSFFSMQHTLPKNILVRGAIVATAALILTTCVAQADTLISTVIASTTNGALSIPALFLSGSWITGGSAVTTKPHVLVEPTGASSVGWSTNGTGFGVNAVSGFLGNLADFKVNGSSVLSVSAAGTTTVTGVLDVSEDIRKSGASILAPAGSMTMFAGSSAPVGYVLCDGSSYSTTTYADLFAVIGYTYGGAGATFAVPDLRGRMPTGVSSGVMGIADKALGAVGGSETHTLTVGQLPPHTHGVTVPVGGVAGNAFSMFLAPELLGPGSQSVTSDSVGEGQSFNILNPYLAVNYIIKY